MEIIRKYNNIKIEVACNSWLMAYGLWLKTIHYSLFTIH